MANVKRPLMLPVRSLVGSSEDQFDFKSSAEHSIRLRGGQLSEPKRRKFPVKTQSLVLEEPESNQTQTSRATLPSNFLQTINPDQETTDPHLTFADRFSTCSSSSSSSGCSSAASSISSSSSATADCEPPSLIIPYLYVGNQAQTQIDTISSLDISYVLSLQSLPKFLDDDKETDKSDLGQPAHSRDEPDSSICSQDQKPSSSIETIEEKSSNEIDIKPNEVDSPSLPQDQKIPINKDGRGILPLVNSSKDYLVKVSSSVNRLIKGKCINISDTFEQLVDKFFDETHNFIEEARRNRCNVLIHCKAGISRSPTIAIAYLMKWKRLHLHEAYNFVKKCRPQISPNLNFMGQLVHYERQLLQSAVKYRDLPSPTSSCLPLSGGFQLSEGEDSCNRHRHHHHHHHHHHNHHHRRRHKPTHERVERPSSLFLPATSFSS